MLLLVLLGTFARVASASANLEAKHFDVVISAAPTHNMALSNGIYSPTGNKAVLNVNDLTSALAAGNLEVTTGNGADGTTQGNLEVNVAMHWVSGFTFTLDAYRSVRVNQQITDAGAGALTIATHDGGKNGRLEFSGSGSIQFWGLANPLSIGGKSYALVNTVAALAAAIAAAPDGNYALANSYDASVDRTYKQSPVSTIFEGNVEGLGNTISNLSTHGDGLFFEIDWGASVSNLRLRNVNVDQAKDGHDNVGGLAGTSNGALYGDETSGKVAAWASPQGAGGLVGSGIGSITNCSSAATVRTRLVEGEDYGAQYIGGLVGIFSGPITDSFATGDVNVGSLTQNAGGLVGQSEGPIRHSHATGNISGLPLGGEMGGLVGSQSSPIIDSYATGNVRLAPIAQGSRVGGLVGSTNSSITRSFATGNVEHSYPGNDGGLVALVSGGPITDSYALGAVGGSLGGGLVGESGDQIAISTSYATGNADGNETGGFACGLYPTGTSNDYWDTTTSGTTYSLCMNQNQTGVTGLTTTQLQSGLPAGFDPSVWAEDKKINHGLPYLIANPPPQ
jgi:hypothetical protein